MSRIVIGGMGGPYIVTAGYGPSQLLETDIIRGCVHTLDFALTALEVVDHATINLSVRDWSLAAATLTDESC